MGEACGTTCQDTVQAGPRSSRARAGAEASNQQRLDTSKQSESTGPTTRPWTKSRIPVQKCERARPWPWALALHAMPSQSVRSWGETRRADAHAARDQQHLQWPRGPACVRLCSHARPERNNIAVTFAVRVRRCTQHAMRPPQYRLSSLSLRKCRSWEGAQPRPRAARRLAAFGLSRPLVTCGRLERGGRIGRVGSTGSSLLVFTCSRFILRCRWALPPALLQSRCCCVHVSRLKGRRLGEASTVSEAPKYRKQR